MPAALTRSTIMSTALCAAAAWVHAQSPDPLFTVRDGGGTARASVHGTGALYVGGAYDNTVFTPVAPVEGAGTRLVWIPEKAAFRVGQVTGTQWDSANLGDYSFAAGLDTRALGAHAVAFGNGSVAAGAASFAAGDTNTASGAASVALGYHAHTNARQGSFVFSDRSSVDEVRAGVNHSASWRVSGGFRIFTSSNLSTGVTIQSGASVSNWGQASAVISTSTGAMLTTGGVWQNASDVNRKHLFAPVDGEAVLARLRSVPIQEWSYRAEPGEVRHLGPTSQDFRAAFGLGQDDKSIGTVDADGVALAGVQALDARTLRQGDEIAALRAENQALRERLAAIERALGAAGQ